MLDLVTLGHIVYDIRCYVEDFPKPDKTSFIKGDMKISGGGCAANVAVIGRKLGLKTAAMGNVGDDEHGGYMLTSLRKKGVDVSRVEVKHGKTAVSIVLVNPQAEVEVVEMLGVAEPVKKIDADFIRSSKFIHIAGTSLGAMEQAASAAKEGVQMVFDPGRSKSRLGHKALSKILRNCRYLVVNRKEIRALTGITDAEKAAAAMHRTYGLTAVIKGGGDPVIVNNGDSFTVPVFKVKPLDTIGAGDAFAAGLVYGLKNKYELKRAVRFANAVAASAVLVPGAQTMLSVKETRRRFRV